MSTPNTADDADATRRPSALADVAPHSSDYPTVTTADTEPFPNGYHFPPKYDWKETTMQGLAAFWKFFTTPMGFFWTIYGLNVVAWGGMLFLLLCNAAPAMCYPTCSDINSPRRKWVEWTCQIVNALFCITGFGLAPWRFRDLYYLLKYRLRGQYSALRVLAGIHRWWFRLPGSQHLPADVGPGDLPSDGVPLPDDVPEECVPLPTSRMPNAPLTGIRAPPTKLWKLDLVIWSMVWNTFLQGALSGVMWGMNRFDRPSWTTGFLVGLACIVAAVGGLYMVVEGNHVKAIEGVALTERDVEKLQKDKDAGVPHFNNIKDKSPKEKVPDLESNTEKSPSNMLNVAR